MDKKYVAAYIRQNGLERMTKEEALKITHLNIAFCKYNDEGKLDSKVKNFHILDKIKEWNPDLKAIISIGGWSNGGYSEAASTEESRKAFAKEAVEFMIKHNLDGLDLDWEYPCCSISGINSSPNDKEHFTLLLKAMRDELNLQGEKDNKYYMLTIAAGADKYYTKFTNMGEAQKYLDYIMLMTYDLRGGFQILSGHHTNLYSPQGDIFTISADEAVKIFVEAGVPAEKLLIGAAFYSRKWDKVPNVNNGYLQVCGTTGAFGPDYTELDREYINKNGYKRYWDDVAKAPYLFNGSSFISYDDEESVKYKCEYVKENNLKGILFWLYDADETGKLLHSISENLEA